MKMLFFIKNKFKILTLVWIFPLLLLILSFSGCVSINKHAVRIEPSVHPVPESSINYKKIEDTELMASSFTLFWFIPVTPEPNINQVIENKIL